MFVLDIWSEMSVFADYNVIDVSASGNCLFACLAIGLGRSTSVSCDLFTRKEIVSFMREHSEMEWTITHNGIIIAFFNQLMQKHLLNNSLWKFW
jgi:hypothetical protein